MMNNIPEQVNLNPLSCAAKRTSERKERERVYSICTCNCVFLLVWLNLMRLLQLFEHSARLLFIIFERIMVNGGGSGCGGMIIADDADTDE